MFGLFEPFKSPFPTLFGGWGQARLRNTSWMASGGTVKHFFHIKSALVCSQFFLSRFVCRLSSNTSGSSKSSSSKIAGVVPDGPLANGNGSYSASATAASTAVAAAIVRGGGILAVWLGRDDGAAAAAGDCRRRPLPCRSPLVLLLLLLLPPSPASPPRLSRPGPSRRIAASRRHCNLAHKWKMASSIQQRISFSTDST